MLGGAVESRYRQGSHHKNNESKTFGTNVNEIVWFYYVVNSLLLLCRSSLLISS